MSKLLSSSTAVIFSSLLLTACASMPKDATVVTNFNAQKYLGTWYEIARMDFVFEKNLNNTTASYTMNKDGSIAVLNAGFDYTKNKWKEARGKAKFQNDPTVGALKVSFFGPFYSGYNVIAIDEDYKYVLVAGKNTKYLWVLSRDKTIPENIKTEYLQIAKQLGYNIDLLIWPKHD